GRPHINAAGHHLSVLLPSERVAIDADATRLAQVFSTLLRNAARHMHARGSINLTATVESGAVLVKIEDAGIGIERGAEQGVGLTLVRGILALHQGSLELRPAESGQGTEAVVRLPLATEPVMAERRAPPASWRRRDARRAHRLGSGHRPPPRERRRLRSPSHQAGRPADAEHAARRRREKQFGARAVIVFAPPALAKEKLLRPWPRMGSVVFDARDVVLG